MRAIESTNRKLVKVRKTTRGGGLNCVFGNFFFYVLDNCPQVQSPQVQSLSEFRVYVQRIM